jgi:superfamily II DNA or RNA helicase
MPHKGTVYLVQDFSTLTIVNPPIGLERSVLTITVKSLEADPKQPWSRKVVRRRTPLFEVAREKPFRVIETDHGLDELVIEYLKDNGHAYEFNDHRGQLPKFDIGRTYGMRFSQKEVLETALNKKRSGLIALPTRYGKSRVALNIIRAYDKVTTVVAVPGRDLVKQTYEFLKEELPERDVRKQSAKTLCSDVLVCSMDSLHHCQHGKVKLLIIDEPHTCVTDSRIDKIRAFHRAMKYGTGATYTGRFDNKDLLIQGVIGPVLAERTFVEAVKEGAICPIDALLVVMPPEYRSSFSREKLIRDNLLMNATVGGRLQMICDILPPEWQTLGFIANEKSAEFFLPFIGREGAIAMAKRMTATERNHFFEEMAEGNITRCLASDIYSQGVTFSQLRVVINLAGGGPYTNSVQRPGRLAEIVEGKSSGIMVDFIFSPTDNPYSLYDKTLVTDSRKRCETYAQKGYNMHFVHNHGELKGKLTELIIKNGGKPNNV